MLTRRLATLLLLIPAAQYSAVAAKVSRPSHARRVVKKKAIVKFDMAVINNPETMDRIGPGSAGSATLRAQILLDRANFSPGEMDGTYNGHTKNAISYFEQSHMLPVDGIVTADVWKALNTDAPPEVVTMYTITAEDVKGPFEPIPTDMAAKAKMTALGFENPLEMFGERFHSSPALLKKLNPNKRFDVEGEVLLAPVIVTSVPNTTASPAAQLPKAAWVVVNGGDLTATAMDKDGRPIASFPASVGSEHDPLPVGDWKITGRSYNPKFHYNPDLFWDSKPGDEKATIPPGPNGPVGVVWIDLSKEHYGIHGTSEPGNIGKTQSHGCVRLTNWDAMKLAGMVAPGTRAILKD